MSLTEIVKMIAESNGHGTKKNIGEKRGRCKGMTFIPHAQAKHIPAGK